MTRTLHEVLKATQGRLISGFPSTVWTGVSIDSRTCRPGDLFFALRGPRFDGHRFLKHVSDRLATALIVDRMDATTPFHPWRNVDVVHVGDTLNALQKLAKQIRITSSDTMFIGLTGSNGKTTTKEMLTRILVRAGKTLSTRGNLNNHIGLPLTLTELDSDHRYAVVEMGTSVPGDMNVLVDILRPQMALITNVGRDHLEFFGTPEGVLKENRKLFDALPSDGIAIINLDDPLLNQCSKTLDCQKVTYGFDAEADVGAEDVCLYPAPLRFTLRLGKKKYSVSMKTQGAMQISNALAAAACAHACGVAESHIVEGLQSFVASAMRMETQRLEDDTILIIDAYNANPSSMRASIEGFFKSYPDRPRWLVLSDMRELGPGARDEHFALGQWIGTQAIDRLFLYGRDARFIGEGIKTSTFKGTVERYRKKRYLVEALKKYLAQPGHKPGILLKASRRMKLEQVSHALSTSQRAMVSET